ncbi:hypothetical protein CBM2598_U40007 [Cupriavidus taiwanensis]|uniref:Uncharacterized protein n=1 Tax=Cupriavidus taiwanensis TaxID=164546 RepID=A0A7Z7NQL1_9BURK|nr:hypothetical protein CBM2597_U40008 [Cupriavidus taiwanensis]SOZ97211.1 hypothetical protein CBM2598_U40007 [Cupriavidus taiwanensis]SPC26102.1 hypothetical protein CBM2594_U40007 [Cupriavidus taiwanensis]
MNVSRLADWVWHTPLSAGASPTLSAKIESASRLGSYLALHYKTSIMRVAHQFIMP